MRLLRTLKYLRWEQIVYRPLRIAQYRLEKATGGRRKVPVSEPQPAPGAGRVIQSAFENSFAHLRCERPFNGEFSFLNRTLEIDRVDWNYRYQSHLWNYHLHYFNSALCFAQAGEGTIGRCQQLIESWIEEAKIGRSDGWDAYPVSLRIVNWIYAYSLVAENYHDRAFIERWRASIYHQLAFLSGHLEFHLLANHLLKNVKAMVIGGLFFNHEKWLKEGESLLWREFDEQVLTDGGHYERSPMYHAQVLADFLECYCLLLGFNRIHRDDGIESKLCAMAGFLEAMSYPDGTLALFNDSANTAEAKPLPIIEAAKRICGYQEKSFPREFKETGYYLWVSEDEKEKIIVDAGPPSIDYNTAHAHCDMLSYELWLDGAPLIVDSGVHGYGGDPYREYCRSTRAHNTVIFDGREQSEVWGTFRMARRATVVDAAASSGKDTWDFQGGYHPYYDSRMVHRRRIRREVEGDWYIEDRLIKGNAVRATSFLHLHPGIQVERVGKFAVECCAGQLKLLIEPFGAESSRVAEGWYFPDFGIAEQSATICFDYPVKNDDPFGYRIKRGK